MHTSPAFHLFRTEDCQTIHLASLEILHRDVASQPEPLSDTLKAEIEYILKSG